MALSDTTLSVPMPDFLREKLEAQAARECSSVAAVARRLIALGITREAPERTTDARELAGVS